MEKMYITEVPAKQIPPLRYKIAADHGIKQVMMTTWGGLGDQVCAEPTLRYAFKLLEGYEISLFTSYPDLFRHLPFKRIYSKQENTALNDEEWLVIHTNAEHGNMSRDFLAHHFTQVVDFCSLSAFQRQLPIAEREIILHGTSIEGSFPMIVIHPGRHWSSKTFPKQWWDEIIIGATKLCTNVAIIGKDIDKDTGTVDVCVPPGVRDLRNKLSLPQLIGVCKNAHVVLTNDSAPLHIAAAGDAEILFIASCKEPDHLLHWRQGRFGFRMKNLGLDGLWNHQSSNPIRPEPLSIDTMKPELIKQLLPTATSVINEIWENL